MRIDVTIALHHEEDAEDFQDALVEALGQSDRLAHFNFLYTVEPKGETDASAS